MKATCSPWYPKIDDLYPKRPNTIAVISIFVSCLFIMQVCHARGKETIPRKLSKQTVVAVGEYVHSGMYQESKPRREVAAISTHHGVLQRLWRIHGFDRSALLTSLFHSLSKYVLILEIGITSVKWFVVVSGWEKGMAFKHFWHQETHTAGWLAGSCYVWFTFGGGGSELYST